MKYVWLCGASEKVSFEDSNNWRRECVDWFKYNSESFRAWNPNDYYNYGEQLHKSDAEIFRFCYQKIFQSDVILVNLENIRQSVGSIMELAWAQQLNKPIVGFYETKFFSYGVEDIKKEKLKDFKNYIHPWVYECCGRIEAGDESIYSILDYIEKYYG